MKFPSFDAWPRRSARLIVLALFAVPLLVACGGGGGAGSSTLNLGIADGPVDSASSVVVSFTGVELQPAGGGGAVTFNFQSPKTIDLLQYQNGNAAALLTGVSVPAGDYSWIRLLLDVGSNGVVANSFIEIGGAQYPIMVPSGAQTGLKLVQGFTMTANQVADFTIDFVLSQAVTAPPGQQAGGTQVYVLRPALRLIDDVQAGTVSGTVALATLQGNAACLSGYSGSGALPGAHVYIFSGAGATLTDIQIDSTTGLAPAGHVNPVVTPQISLSSSGQYSYSQPFLLAGTYTLAIACGADDPSAANTLVFIPAAGTNATVTADQTTTINF